MTSSLVGSEMCIRDRANSVVVPPLQLPVGHHGYTFQPPPPPPEFGTPTPCLLYTSDAADDM
eukprot:3348226-Prorocentrum_lima.AAC.1